MSKERMQILKMIEDGQISTEEATRLLEALNGVEPPDEVETDVVQAVEPPSDEAVGLTPEATPVETPKVGNWWLAPVIAGAVVMAIGAPLMALGITGNAAWFWAIFCGWGPFLTGLAILTLGVWSRNAPWFHLRVTNVKSGKRTFALSLPLPLTLTAWGLKIARPFVPQLDETRADEAILALRDGLTNMEDDQPFFIDVQDDDEDGEHVQIYFG